MKKTAVFYGSTTGNTEGIAKDIAEKLGAEAFDVSETDASKMEEYDNLILGTSTWGAGDLQDDWESFIDDMGNVNLEGKTVALFGLGDGMSYSDTFVDGMGTIYQAIADKCNVVGFTETEGYDFEESTAVVDGKFIGLPIDEDNESDQTGDRVEKWVEQLKNQLS